ncbi:Uncharacterised protein [Shigella sonnei]|nr:Uncharacterised protein [Shigella sonnei]CSG70568.1 Uncharacterised protein [Shigella sonnei]
MLHLAFFGTTNTYHRLLYLTCRVFKYRQFLIHRRHNRHAARLPQFQSRVGIFGHKDLFNGEIIWLELGDDFRHARIDELQTRR